uniref:Sodium-and chloride-dependent glycine transporter 2 n=2 Tax=Caenorhabditis tropicalis TaxID=1561998 RepID=A0A1I7TG94_9PELO
MQHPDQIYGYSTIILAAAPFASQLAMANIRWIFFFPLFAFPALALMLTVGHLSKSAHVQTFRKLAPIAAGIGWALTWHIAEKLYVESLRASQLFMYIMFSIRTELSWAISCEHEYNTEYCHDFTDPNITVTSDDEFHKYPNNFWPAQEFNKYLIRHNQANIDIKLGWEPNMWYLGKSYEPVSYGFPSVPLIGAHILTWSVIYVVLTKYYDRLGDILFRVFIVVPMFLYMTVMIGMTGFGFHFTTANIFRDGLNGIKSYFPLDFWMQLAGWFRTSILVVDYSTAFTGIVLLATSRLRSGVNGLTVWILVPLMMIIPTMQTIIRLGCEGHVADLQPGYVVYASTDETVSFDLLPVCFASTSFGPVWSVCYYLAHYLYSSLGAMLVFVSFIYQSFIDDFPIVQNSPKRCIGMIALAFFLPSILLYMPEGTKVAAFFRYASQTCFVEIAIFIIIFFVYGWQRLERDVLMTTEISSRPSILEYFARPTSPVFLVLQFTIIPMLLSAKLAAIFDFLSDGSDIVRHIYYGSTFLPLPEIIRSIVGGLLVLAPVIIMLVGAALIVYQMVVKHGMTFKDTLKPSAEWMSHTSVNANKPRPHSLAYSIISRLVFRRISHRSAIFALFLFETFIGIFLTILFFMNTVPLATHMTGSRIACQYRSMMLLVFVVCQIYALFEMRKCQQYGQIQGERLSFYIGLATLQMGVMNGYMWMFGEDHMWGTDWPPLIIIGINLMIRGFCILLAIAVRAHSIEHNRPSNTREASEIDDAERGRNADDAERVDDDDDDDSPVIFDIARS